MRDILKLWYLVSGQLQKDIRKIMASLADVQAAVAALQVVANKTQSDVARLVQDFKNVPTPAQLAEVVDNVNAVAAQLSQTDDDVNAADPVV